MSKLQEIWDIPIKQIISKYTDSNIIDTGTWQSVRECPKCRHEGCCKININNNTAACFSERRYYLDPIRTIEWLFDIDSKEAVMKLAQDFNITLPSEWEKDLEENFRNQRRIMALTTFAEKCHNLLTAEHRQYWKQRGLTDEIIDAVKIGFCPGDGSVIKALQAEGFTIEELREWHLVSVFDYKEYYHYEGRKGQAFYYTLPNWDGNKVIDIQGRCTINDPLVAAPRYKNAMGTVESLYNPKALKEEIVYLAEGVPDTLSLMQMGLNACGAYGVGGVKDEWATILCNKNKVYIVFDKDKAGQDSAYKLARRIGDNARIVTLVDEKDVNELLAKHGTEQGIKILQVLIDQARTALEIDIAALPAQPGEVDDKVLKEIMSQVFDLPSTRQLHYKEKLRQHFTVTKKEIDSIFSNYRKQANASPLIGRAEAVLPAQILLVEDPSYIRLAQAFALSKVFYCQEFDAVSGLDGTQYVKKTFQVITSDRELLPIPVKSSNDPMEIVQWNIAGNKLSLRRPLTSATRRWSKTGTPFSLDRFLKGDEEKVLLSGLYRGIEQMFRSYYYTAEEYDYIILSLFTLFTYYYELYDAVPYLFLNGQPETGKTTICILLQHLTFNGDMVSNISPSALFREAEQKQLTLILDEQEGISNRKANEDKGDFLSIIKDAYKRTGTVKRQSIKDASITEEFTVYNPLVIANVMGLEDILKTRTIGITTSAAPIRAISQICRLRSSSPSFLAETQIIRDQCYCWVMQNHELLRRLPAMDFSSLVSNRAEELFQPLLALATIVDQSDENADLNLVGKLTECLPNKLFRRDSVRTRDIFELLRDACLELLAEQGVTGPGQEGKWISSLDILDKLVETNDGRFEDYMKPTWIGEKITDANWIATDRDKNRREITTVQRDRNQLKIVNGDPPVTENRKIMHYYLRYERIARQ